VSHQEIRAAGAVLWRGTGEALRIALVHRPRYDDWSLPKGKVDPGETIVATAVREVLEETGFHAILGRHLAKVRYQVPNRNGEGTSDKTVDYFSAEAVDGEFVTNDEVDELRWTDAVGAEALLSRNSDVEVVRTFYALPAELTKVLLVRHAKAGKRDEWNGADDLRPLAATGLRQAEALRAMLPMFGVDRVLSAPLVRCEQTVQGVADDLGVEIRPEPLLSEEGYWPDPVLGIARLLAIAGDGGTPLISSQGGVIPDIVSALADSGGVSISASRHGVLPSKKGSLWVLSFVPASGNDGPKLVDADYFASALPVPEPARP
jgi:8-oxo-dGTP pyrophosphatase MutT (NUDIX family)/phosphohistidine phosphatase SixA